jgi:hypothetical protein
VDETGDNVVAANTSASTEAGGAGGGTMTGGAGGSPLCAVDCSAIMTPPCLQSVCNDGMYQGVIGECVVVPLEAGAPCDDGLFCTVQDGCDGGGNCEGGPENDCGMTPSACNEVDCVEASMSCTEIPSGDGSPCQDPTNLCLKGSTCANGLCIGGSIDDCFFFPVPDDCHVAVCNPLSGMCEPQIGNEGLACNDAMDLCTVNKTCVAGVCQGGVPKDCSSLSVGCNLGVCDVANGMCVQQPLMNGDPCTDFNNCTLGDTCQTGQCVPTTTITQCTSGDMCCPQGCDSTTDTDCSFCDWNPGVFPIGWGSGSSVGDMTFDGSCNIYFGDGGNSVRRVNHNTSTVTTLSTFTTYVRGIEWFPGNGLIYAAVNDKLYSMTTQGQNLTVVPNGTIGGILQGMTVSPPTWGSYGNHLVIARSDGAVYAFNPLNPSAVLIGTTTPNISDAEFDQQNGVLYIAAYTQNKVYTLSPSGTFTTFANTPCGPDGLAVESGQRVFITCGGANQLYALAIPTGVATLISTASLNASWAPAGALWDGQDNLIVMEEPSTLKVYTP